MTISIASTSLVRACCFSFLVSFIIGCKPTETKSTPSGGDQSQAESNSDRGTVAMQVAPFDRFTTSDTFPILFRFSEAVAPAERTGKDIFSDITIRPSKFGSWWWETDSELRFFPKEPWKPSEKVDFSLDKLTLFNPAGKKISPSAATIVLPDPILNIVECRLAIKNRAPLIQYPVFTLRFNYTADFEHALTLAKLTLKRSGKEEALPLHSPGWTKKGMRLTLQGPELFRPEEKTELAFEFREGLRFVNGGTLQKSSTCSITTDPVSWDAIAEQDSTPAKTRRLVVPALDAPDHMLYSENKNYRTPVRLHFREAWGETSVEHGRAKGLTLDAGLTLAPEVEGTWKADETDPNYLNFTPTEDWPVGTSIKVEVEPNTFPEVDFKERSAEFVTPPIETLVTDLAMYTDPTNPSIRQVTGKLQFSHQPKLEEIEQLLQVRLRTEPEKKFFDGRSTALKFTLTADPKKPWVIYVRSENLALKDEPGEVLIQLNPGLHALQGGTPSKGSTSSRVKIPSKREIFKVESASVSNVKNRDERYERVLTVDVTEPATAEELLGGMELFILPDCQLTENEKLCRKLTRFSDESAVFPEVWAKSEAVSLSPVPRDETTSPNMFHFTFQSPGERELFLRVKSGTKSTTGFSLAGDYRSVFFTTQFPRELTIMHQGALLSLSSSRKLGVSARGVPKVEYELARILARDVHHLVSVNSGNFQKPYLSGQIALDQLAERFRYVEAFPDQEPGATRYSSVDFGRFMSRDASPRGLFLLTLREKKDKKDEEKKNVQLPACGEDGPCEGEGEEEYEGEEGDGEHDYSTPLEDSRLVLLTDLGILVKDNLVGEHDVFVMSFRTGAAVKGATVKLLGQNGVPIFTQTTSSEGRVTFPSTKDFEREKRPLVYVVEQGEDYSFLPFGRYDRALNFSRFETGGVMNNEEAEGLRALIFSDRGIYRPGEEARFGIIVRRRNLGLAGANIPLEISLSDPRGVEILKRKFATSKLGFDDFRWSAEGALTGTYTLGIYLVREQAYEKRSLLGSSSFRVDEFQPDKLSVKTKYVDETAPQTPGWMSPKGKFEVDVQNLFGTPAVGNTVKGTLLARPWDGNFAEHPGYLFYSREGESKLPEQPEDLGELTTDEKGRVRFAPDLSKFAEKAFRVEFASEALEKDSGRSVVSTASALISQVPHFLGWKADGNLSFIGKGSERKVKLLSVGADLKPRAVSPLQLRLEETKMISTLIKQPDGTLRYQMSPKVTEVWTGELAVPEAGQELSLRTAEAGDYRLRIYEGPGVEIASVPYTVHGEGNTNFMADRNAEVGIRLSKTSVEKNEELEISISTPYVGAGLITIEREKVYAAKWFQGNSLSTVQRIKVPEGIVGNAYVSVAFVRSLDSKDIFAAPLSYGVKPFSIAKSEYTSRITLSAPEKVKPGSTMEVTYQSDIPGRFVVYAVDEGILQFAKYRNPDPVQSFVPKRSLEVRTFQILDLLLPDYKIVSELSSPGGDEDVGLGKFKNPFARRRRPPMAFWSGVLPENLQQGKVQIPIPDYFNGTLRLIAVQVGEDKMGIQTAQTISQNDFVIDPQVPYFVSPGDEFEIGATVANTLVGSGNDVKLQVEVLPSAGFEPLGERSLELTVPEKQDRSFRMKVRAKEVLGEQSVEIQAKALGSSLLGRESKASETISLRPPQAYRTTLQAGIYNPNKDGQTAKKGLDLTRSLYPEKREVQASISASPLSIASGLVEYLKGYPYGCTEQLVSTAFPAVIFGADPELGLSPADVERYTKRAFQALSARQRADGSFGLWDLRSDPDTLFSVYAVHYLIEARDHSLEIPENVLDRGLAWLKTLNSEKSYDAPTQLAQAYALYVRARTGERVTKEAQALVAELDRQWQDKWRHSANQLFLAATFQQLQMDKEATALLRNPPQVWASAFPWPLSDASLYGAVYSWLTSKHFPKSTWLSPLDTAVPVARMIESKSYNSFTSSFSLLGLDAFSHAMSESSRDYLRITPKTGESISNPLELFGTRILRGEVPLNTPSLQYSGKDGEFFFYQASEAGFDQKQAAPYANGLTIERELRNEKGEKQSSFSLDEKLEVKLFIKSEAVLTRMVIPELVPGGFEIDLSDEGLAQRRSLHQDSNSWQPTFIDIQEDRILFFGDLPADTVTFTYRLKPLSRGKFSFAAPYAEGMYDQTKGFLGSISTIDVH